GTRTDLRAGVRPGRRLRLPRGRRPGRLRHRRARPSRLRLWHLAQPSRAWRGGIPPGPARRIAAVQGPGILPAPGSADAAWSPGGQNHAAAHVPPVPDGHANGRSGAGAAVSAARAKIVLAGGNGALGRRICADLADAGYDLVVLTRSPQP